MPSPQYPTTCPKPCKGRFVYNLVEPACVDVHREPHEVMKWHDNEAGHCNIQPI